MSNGACMRSSRYGVTGHSVRTQEERPLLAKPARVVSLIVPDEKCKEGAGQLPCGTLLWTLRPTDTNKDGTIDYKDAAVAYLSRWPTRLLVGYKARSRPNAPIARCAPSRRATPRAECASSSSRTALAKLRWLMIVQGFASTRSYTHVSCRVRRIVGLQFCLIAALKEAPHCTAINLCKELGETAIEDRGVLDAPSWRWPER